MDTKDAIKMSKANSNFDHLSKDKYGDKEVISMTEEIDLDDDAA